MLPTQCERETFAKFKDLTIKINNNFYSAREKQENHNDTQQNNIGFEEP